MDLKVNQAMPVSQTEAAAPVISPIFERIAK